MILFNAGVVSPSVLIPFRPQHYIADVVAIIGTMDLVFGCVSSFLSPPRLNADLPFSEVDR